MAIISLDYLKIFLGATTSAKDALYTVLADAASKAVKTYTDRDFESATYTEYYNGSGTHLLILRQRPVTSVTSVHVDATGYAGDGTNAFASDTLQTVGVDYILRKERGTQGDSGMLVRLRGFMGQSAASLFGEGVLGWTQRTDGKLAGNLPPAWPRGDGNIKVVYVAGYTAANMPADLKQATAQLAAWMVRNGTYGGDRIQSENMGQYSYTLGQAGLSSSPELGSTRSTLLTYKNIVI